MTDTGGHENRPFSSGDQQQESWSSSQESAPPESPDLASLARDWITLWQSELAAMAADRETQEAWQTTLAMWAGLATAALRTVPRARTSASPRSRPDERGPGGARPDDAARAAATAAAPDPRDAEIERLAGHVAALEARLAKLERGRDSPRPRKRKS